MVLTLFAFTIFWGTDNSPQPNLTFDMIKELGETWQPETPTALTVHLAYERVRPCSVILTFAKHKLLCLTLLKFQLIDLKD